MTSPRNQSSAPDGVSVPARVIPFPASISAEARASLAGFVKAQGIIQPRQRPAPDDFVGWAERKDEINRMLVSIMSRFKVDAAVETKTLGGVTVHVATPKAQGASADERAYLDIHGGGLIYGAGEACRIGAAIAATTHRVRAFAVDYRTPPEHPYPAALDDCLSVYRALLNDYAPENIIVGGGSAGGNLAAALALRARDERLPLPAALVLLTPEVDLTESGDSFEVNRFVDVVLVQGLLQDNVLYANGHDLVHPYLSPLFGDFTKGFPSTFLQAGTRDLFLSNAVRMHRALRKAGVPVELHVFEGMPHGGFFGSREDIEMRHETQRFVAAHWGREIQ